MVRRGCNLSGALLVVLCALAFVTRGVGTAYAQEGGYAVASLSSDHSGGTARGMAPVSRPVGIRAPESLTDALATLRRMAGAIAAAESPEARARLRAQLAVTHQFVRGLGVSERRLRSYQWHRVGGALAEAGVTSLVARPMPGMGPVSAIALEVRGGAAAIDRVRVHASGGAIYEFHPRKAIDTTWREGEVFLLDREIELAGIEVIYLCPPDAQVLPTLAVQAGVSTLPPYERACAERLALARREFEQGRLQNAEAHLRRAVALLEQHRRAITP